MKVVKTFLKVILQKLIRRVSRKYHKDRLEKSKFISTCEQKEGVQSKRKKTDKKDIKEVSLDGLRIKRELNMDLTINEVDLVK